MAYLPVESLIRDRQAEYYEALGASDRLAEATPFVEFMLTIIRETLDAAPVSDQATDQASDQVKALLKAFGRDADITSDELLRLLGLPAIGGCTLFTSSRQMRSITPALRQSTETSIES